MPRIVALTHVECEGLGWWGEFCRDRGIEVERVRLNDGAPLPDLERYGAVLVLGGPMNVDEDDRYPWLGPEKEAIRRLVAAERPVLGICLGAQLVARACGAKVVKNDVKEIGWHLVTPTDEGQADPLLAGLPTLLPVFQWHGDTFELPPGGTLLAASTLCAHQAFRVGRRAYGLQFHVEVTPDMVSEWARAYREEVATELPAGAGQRMIEQARATATAAKDLSRAVFARFCEVAGLG